MKQDTKPPVLGAFLLRMTASKEQRGMVLEDFEEQYSNMIREKGIHRARVWYSHQSIQFLKGRIFNTLCWKAPMLKNHLKMALRNFHRNRGYTLLNLSGLSMGIAASLVILLYVSNELSYDQFHEKADRIYRVGVQFGPNQSDKSSFTPPPLAAALKADFPEIEAVVRVNLWKRTWVVRNGDSRFVEKEIIFADSTVFDVFSFQWIAGDPRTALSEPRKVVITDRMAAKYFPDREPLGAVLRMNEMDWMVSGVVEELPKNSHFRFDFLASLSSTAGYQDPSWMGCCYFTYIVLSQNASPRELEPKLQDFFIKHYGPQYLAETGSDLRDDMEKNRYSLGYFGFFLQPLLDIHLNGEIYYITDMPGDRGEVMLFSSIAFSILLLACINFVNLSTARSGKRAREVGMRKTLGTTRGSLFNRFFVESVMTSLTAFLIALFLVYTTLPFFNMYLNRDLSVHLEQNPILLLGFLMLAVLVGLGAGVYPAFVLSAFRPVEVLKGRFSGNPRGKRLRNCLVIFQFTVSIGLIFGTLVIGRQLRYIRQASLGFDKTHILVIDRFPDLGGRRRSFIQSLTTNPDVLVVSNTNSMPGRHFEPNGYSMDGRPKTEDVFFWTMYADFRFHDLLGLKVVQGTFFSETPPADEIALVINETAVRENRLEDPIGQTLSIDGERGRIIGVVRDFHFQSLHRPVEQMMIAQLPALDGNTLCVKLRSGGIERSIRWIREQWDAYSGGAPFQYTFLDAEFQTQYDADRRTSLLFLLFSGMALLIACLGIFGLASSAMEQRKKEIGIRKVAGASTGGILLLLMIDFAYKILFAFLIAGPVAYFLMQRWLENFAYRTGISWWIFAVSCLGTTLIGLLTVSLHTLRAALANPAKSLRNE